jgi:hypothetical protein
MIRLDTAERRARLAVRHHLAPSHRVATPLEAARGVVCLHATDPATVYLSVLARTAEPSIEGVESALYQDRSLLRMLAMRRTLFVVPTDEAPVLHAASALEVARRERARNEQLVAMMGEADPAAWLREVEAATLTALDERGEATAAELSKAAPVLARKVRMNVGKSYEGDIGISSRVLIALAAEGRIVRGRPRGTWISSQYRWAWTTRWLGAPLEALDPPTAQARLVSRWLERFGPGTEADLRWWTGLTARDVRQALASVDAVEVALEGLGSGALTGYVLPGDLEPTPAPEPWVALLPELDATTMGWQARDWYLGDHRAQLFDGNGNAGPTIWVDGRIIGGWAVRDAGEVVTGLLEDVGREAAQTVEAEAARLSAFLAGQRVVPRFPTPHLRELMG